MNISERERLALFEKVRERLGEEEAGTLMELLPPTGWGEMATRSDLFATSQELRGEMAEVRGEMAEVRGEMAEVRGEMAELRSELRGEMAELRSDFGDQFAALRDEVASIRPSVDRALAEQSRTVMLWIAGSTISIWLTFWAQALIA